MANHKWIRGTEEVAIIDAMRSGLSESETMQRFKISKGTVRRLRRKAGLVKTSKPAVSAFPVAEAEQLAENPIVAMINQDAAQALKPLLEPETQTKETPVEPPKNSAVQEPVHQPPAHSEPEGFECETVTVKLAVTHDKADSIWQGFTLAEKAAAIEGALKQRWLTA